MKSTVLRIVGILALMLTVSGCSVLKAVEDSPMTAELFTNQMTLRFAAGADDPAERATKIRDTLDTIQVGLGGEYTLLELDAKVREEINWQKYSMADQELLNFAITKARVVLSDLIGEGLVDADEKIRIDTLFRWVDQAAARVQ